MIEADHSCSSLGSTSRVPTHGASAAGSLALRVWGFTTKLLLEMILP